MPIRRGAQGREHPARDVTRYARRRGFSLLEVMIAVGLFGLFLTAVLAAQGDSIRSNRRAANMGTATSIARCRMTELEERLLKLGYPLIDETDSSDNCCNDTAVPGYTCEWRIERVELPPVQGNVGDAGLSMGSFMSGDAGAMGMPTGLPGTVSSALTNPGGGSDLNFDGGLQALGMNVQQTLGSMGGTQGLLGMVFSIVYPSLKPLLEASIRRVTVTIKWTEPPKDRELTLVQYVTNPVNAGFMMGVPDAGGVPGATGTGTSGTLPRSP
jgi:general secretion pathway protein I